jgi:hypothetical protein
MNYVHENELKVHVLLSDKEKEVLAKQVFDCFMGLTKTIYNSFQLKMSYQIWNLVKEDSNKDNFDVINRYKYYYYNPYFNKNIRKLLLDTFDDEYTFREIISGFFRY